jgi:phosphoesterase RecJ-like protein
LITNKWVDEYIATCLLTGILTDTNNFTIPLVNEKTFKVAWELLERWAKKDDIIKNVFQNKTLNQIKLQWLIIDRITKLNYDKLNIYYSYYTEKDLEQLNIDLDDPWTGKELVWILTTINDADFVCLFKIKENETSISFRSKEYDVNQFASKFWGWWHKNAAGAKIDESILWENIEKILLEKLEEN